LRVDKDKVKKDSKTVEKPKVVSGPKAEVSVPLKKREVKAVEKAKDAKPEIKQSLTPKKIDPSKHKGKKILELKRAATVKKNQGRNKRAKI
jgi:hypothetical protein